MSSIVYMEYRPGSTYPQTGFNPSTRYPEYPFGAAEVQDEPNCAYDMVRQTLFGLGLDTEQYGNSGWNPLGAYIVPGDTVLIKPNWVMHFNGNKAVKRNAMECLVTHSSCLRAICDYCLIALKGHGKVIIGDAPMQDCDLEKLIAKTSFHEVVKFYAWNMQPVEVADFRRYQSIFDKNMVITGQIHKSGNGVSIDLGDLSMHEKRQGSRLYQVDNYDKTDTQAFHTTGQHVYSIQKDVLAADVIINFCKPKSHRLAGFTGALKNMVGITFDKASLPHRVAGSVEEGGDAYPYKNLVKRAIDAILDKKIEFEKMHRLGMATLARFAYGALYEAERVLGKDSAIKGIWYGNDTIWRTVVDLNYIERYADQMGIMQGTQQRRILNFADMIISGEHNGPCSPEPKYIGVMAVSEDAVALDRTICRMMGFPPERIPLIRAIERGEAEGLLGAIGEVCVKSNDRLLCGALQTIEFPQAWRFKPHEKWEVVLGKDE